MTRFPFLRRIRVEGALAPGRHARQRGAALLVVMIFLVVAALLGTATTLGSVGGSRDASLWSDRQRAVFLADTVASQVQADIRTLAQETSGDLAAALRVPAQGYYVRADGNAPDWMGWPADSATGSRTVGNFPAARYFVVYEGASPGASGGLLFTLAVRARAQVNGTAAVVLQTFELIPN